MNYDVVIIGGGAAGFTAGIFTARRGLKTLLISKDLGGQTASTCEIENYPGVGRIEGPELIKRVYQEAMSFGVEILFKSVETLYENNGRFEIATNDGQQYISDAIILAFGKSPRKLRCQGEDTFEAKGIWYANIPEPQVMKGKTVAVIGGGNSAVQAAIQLGGIASHCYLIHRRDILTAEEVLLKRFSDIPSIEFLPWHEVTAILGDKEVQELIIKNTKDASEKTLAINGICIATGFEPASAFLGDFVECDSANRVIINQNNETSRAGVFAAGDATIVPFQQIVISAGEGAKAAISAYHYIAKKQGMRALKTDWGFLK